MSESTQCGDCAPRKIFVGQKAHSRSTRIDLLGGERVAGVAEAGPDVVDRQVWVVFEDFRLVPAVGEQAEDELDREPSASYDRLAGERVGIEDNAGGVRSLSARSATKSCYAQSCFS